jgi:hypothetical protein
MDDPSRWLELKHRSIRDECESTDAKKNLLDKSVARVRQRCLKRHLLINRNGNEKRARIFVYPQQF